LKNTLLIKNPSPFKTLGGPLGGGLAIGLLAAVSAVAAGGTTCFDDIEQHYEEDDGGFMWRSMPDRCPGSPQPASPAERKRGSSVEIRASGQDAIVIEKNYWWAPKRNGPDGECPRYVKHESQRTRIAKGGVLYETKLSDEEPPKQSQRAMRQHENIYISNMQSVVKPNPSMEYLGDETIAGQPCRRLAPKPPVGGAAKSEICFFVAPVDCPNAAYLMPLEMTTKAPDGQMLTQGRTTLLRVGSHGQVVSPDSIRAP
jgi:hypothetical protein